MSEIWRKRSEMAWERFNARLVFTNPHDSFVQSVERTYEEKEFECEKNLLQLQIIIEKLSLDTNIDLEHISSKIRQCLYLIKD